MMKCSVKLLLVSVVAWGLSACDTSNSGGTATDGSQSPGIATEEPATSLPIVQIEGIDMIEDEVVLSIFQRDADSEPYDLDQVSLKIEID